MVARLVRIRFFSGLKRRLRDPAWPDPGSIPFDWLLDGAPRQLSDDGTKIVTKKFPGIRNLTGKQKKGPLGIPAANSVYMRHPDALDTDDDPDFMFAEYEMLQENVEGGEDILHFRFWKVRRSQLPSLHNLASGAITPLALDESEGLAEAVDYVLFRDSCVVGVLINRAGPSRQHFLDYIREKTGVELKLVPLTREDAVELVNGDRVTSVDVEVVSGHFDLLAALGADMSQKAENVSTPGIQTVTLSLSVEKEKRSQFWHSIKPKLKELLSVESGIKNMKVDQASTDAHSAQTSDLLADIIAFEAKIEIEIGRTVEVKDAQMAIVHGKDDNDVAIKSALDRLDAKGHNKKHHPPKPPDSAAS